MTVLVILWVFFILLYLDEKRRGRKDNDRDHFDF